MGTQIHNRAVHQHHNPNMKVGKLKPRAASNLETEKLKTAIAALQKAIVAEEERTMLLNVSEAFRITREVFRGRQ